MSSPHDRRGAPGARPLRFPVPSRATRIDWTEVARMLAEGRSTTYVAEIVGCSRQHIWRILSRSRSLGWAINDRQMDDALEADATLAGLRPWVAEQLSQMARDGNERVLLFLARQLGIGGRGPTYNWLLRSREKDPLDPLAPDALDPKVLREKDEGPAVTRAKSGDPGDERCESRACEVTVARAG